MEFDKLYTVDDVAEYTGLTSRTIRNYLKDGTLVGRKIGGQWRFTMKNIMDLLGSNSTKDEIASSHDQFLLDFIAGVNTDITGELQTCVISDYYCRRAEDAAALDREFSAIPSAPTIHGDDFKYFHYYKEDEQKARFIFFGTPEVLGIYIERLKTLWQELSRTKKQFNGRSINYLSGREDYPTEFFEYLYNEFAISTDAVIADIGSGIGTMSKHFLERGNTVYCIEPNEEMKCLSDQLLLQYRNYHSFLGTAENTRLKTSSVDYIVCGNVFGSLSKSLIIPEFSRILKDGGRLIITHYYPYESPASDDMRRLWSEFKSQAALENDKLIGKEFIPNKAASRTFYKTHRQDFSHFLSGCLSSAIAPGIGDARYDYFVNRLKEIFDRHSMNGFLECKYQLLCLIGEVSDLVR